MKYNNIPFFLVGALLLAPAGASAQEETTDSVEVVNVAYRQQAAGDILGGVSYINMEELAKKNYTTYSLEDMQGYVGGWNGNSLWGMDGDNAGYMVLVDGVPRDANNVLPSEISQITFLKGAQAVVLYGTKAAKGAILITTKRGKNDGIRVQVTGNTGWQVAKAYPEYLGAAEYMTLYNEALANDGKPALYTQQDIYNHASGVNPYRYTDINYFSKDYLKKAYNRSEFTAEISGGAKRAHFYTNVNYYRNGDFLNFGEAKNNYTDRFNVRGNVDVEINSFITAYANANATFYNGRSAMGDFWSATSTMRPNFPQGAAPLIPLNLIDPNAAAAWDLIGTSSNIIDGEYFLGGTQANSTNAIAAGYVGGKSKYTSRQFQFDAGVNVDLAKVTKGLSFKAMMAVDYATTYNTSFNNNYAVYVPTWSNYGGKEVIVGLTKQNVEQHSGVQNISGSTDNQTIAFNAHLDYDRTFAEKHHVNAMALISSYQRTLSATYHRNGSAHLGVMAGYDYDKRYYLNFSGAEVHSARLPEGNRNKFSPSVSVGWRLGNEKFIKDKDGLVNDLMLSAAYSIVNEDIDLVMGDKEYYLYEGLWSTAYGYGWNDGFSKQYTYSTQGSNPSLSYIQRKEWSVNMRGQFFHKILTADLSFFHNQMQGYLIEAPSSFPSHLKTGWPDGSFMPVVNNNARKHVGMDFSLRAQKKFRKVEAALGFSGTFYEATWTKYDEVVNEPYQSRVGHDVDEAYGYRALGLFKDDAEIASAPVQNLGTQVKPGDIRYEDVNKDGVVDNKDQVWLGKRLGYYGTPLTMGVNFTLKYKGFTFFALGTAGFGGYGYKNGSYYWVQGDGKYSAVVRDRWTPATAATATYPRLSSASNSNNFCNSDFWLYKTNRFDLTKVQLTYDFREDMFKRVIKGLSVYASGHGLLTLSPERKHMEMNVGSAPQSRFYTVGVKATF
ncbi:MAG: SusC/RagA family TonB-linked outer membrane protein [Bacteroidaceae bacterium]|nr:SusC/RagA family TonB-linked outer membrane protein [Bacteroidaceae bacterium]